jgi:hypothetical protein
VTPEAWLLTLGIALGLLLTWTFWTLTRLRRLDVRVARAWLALDTQLQRRAGLAEELAREYPAAVGERRAAYLSAFAADARNPADGDRETAENVLGRELRELARTLGEESGGDLHGVPVALRNDLVGTATRIGLARRFYNDAVRDALALRSSRFVRLTGLHRSRPLPRYFDIDDRLEVAGTREGGSGPAAR